MVKHINNFKIILLILSIVLISCKTIEYQKLGFEDYNQLILNKDGTFYQQIKNLTPTELLYGNWQKEGDTILLDIKKPKAYFIEDTKAVISELHFGDKDSIYFNVKLKNCSTNSGNLYLNNNFRTSVFSYTDSNSYFKIQKQKIKCFYISASGSCFAGINHKVIDTSANYFKIEMLSQFDYLEEPNSIINPTRKYITKNFKLIPIIYDSLRPEFALKRKFIRLKKNN